MELIDLYQYPALWHIPFHLLEERDKDQNISHKKMPTWEEHQAFVRSHPYKAWYMFNDAMGSAAGCIYLSRNREIGIGVFKKYQGRGLATIAIQELMRLHPGQFLANINPKNKASIKMFAKFGAKHIQNTYELESA